MPSLTKVQPGFISAQGAIELDSGTASAPSLKFATSSATGMFSPSTGALAFSTGSTQNALTILSGGNVGIGTTNPVARLYVYHQSSDASAIFKSVNAGAELSLDAANGYAAIKILNSGTETWRVGNVGQVSNFEIWQTGIGNRLTISSAGNVGIGITTPTRKLDVEIQTASLAVGSVLNAHPIAEFINLSGGGSRGLEIGSPADSVSAPVYLKVSGTGNRFAIVNQSDSEQFTIVNSGNVGIGTTNPQRPLHVTGSGIGLGADADIRQGSGIEGGTSYARLQLYNPATGTTTLENLGAFAVDIRNNGSSRIYINSSGNVGIGTTDPLSKLHITGQLQTANPSTYSTITGIDIGNSYPIYCTEVNAGSGGFTPFILQRTVVNNGYRQVLSIGSYRAAGGTYTGGAYIAPGGGSDSTPTDYFLFSYQGALSYSGGTISFPGQIQSTQGNNAANGGGQIYLNGSTGNRIDFNGNGVAAPTFTTRSVGTKIVLTPAVDASNVDYAFGIENGTLWSSVQSALAQFKWYAGTTNVATLTGGGNLTVTGEIQATLFRDYNDNNYYVNPAGTSRLNTLRIFSNTSADWDAIQISSDGVSGLIQGLGDEVGLRLRSELGSIILADDRGNVGVGTTNPSSKLEVIGNGKFYSSAGNTELSVGRLGDGIYYNSIGIYSGYNATQPTQSWGQDYLGCNYNYTSSLNFYQYAGGSSYTHRAIISSTGNVGIGTANPSDKLHVYGGRLIVDNILSNQSGIQFNQAGTEMAVLYRPASISNQLRMYLTGGGDVMTWNNSGNVGIGTTNPSTKLEVVGTVSASSGLRTLEQVRATGWWDTPTGSSYSGLAVEMGMSSGNGYILCYNRDNGNWGTLRIQGSYGSTMIELPASGSTINITGNIDASGIVRAGGSRLVLRDDSIENHATDTDTASIVVNYYGYLSGTTRFRDFQLFNGKTGLILKAVGSTGNVGIGTADPGEPLTIYRNINSGSQVRQWNASNGSSAFAAYRISSDSSNSVWWWLNSSTRTVDGGASTSTIRNDAGDMRLQAAGEVGLHIKASTGNVGIGSAGPTSKLDVVGSIKSQITGGGTGFLLHTNTGWSAGSNLAQFWTGQTNGFAFYANATGNESNELVRVSATGNVGIAVTNPIQKLDVRGNFLLAADSTTATHITQKPYTVNNGTLSWEGSAGQLFSITNNLTVGSIFSVNDVSGIPSIDVDANGTIKLAPFGGNVGIGTTNPTTKLHVIGDILASGNVTAYSDLQLKDNIEIIDNALEKVLLLRGVTFTRIDTEDKDKKHVGVIAQEVEQVLPEVVQEHSDGIKSVAYGNMVGLLIEAIKEQQSQIETLKAEIESLKKA